MTNLSGGVYDSLDYLPFGEQIAGGTGTTHKFTGKERDGTILTETGLDYFGARYNSSQYGRFMTPDWSSKPMGVPYADMTDPQSLNLYSYVRNNPLSRTDPTGHHVDDDDRPAWKRFSQALKNIVSVKIEGGAAVKFGGSFGGLKVKGGSGTSTEVKSYPMGNKPTEVKTTSQSSLEVKVGPVKGELKSVAPSIDPATGNRTEGSTSAKGGAGGENVSGASLSSDGEISLIGLTAEVGAIGGGAEVVLNTGELGDAARSLGPAIMESIGIFTGFSGNRGGDSANPFPGFTLPNPGAQ